MNKNGLSAHFRQYIAEGNILCRMDSESHEQAIGTLAARLAKNNAGVDAEAIRSAVIARENVIPTVIAPGLAVPHARMAEISNLLIAIGTSLSGIDFKAAGMPPVNVVIMILSPKDNPGIHLQVMAALAKEFSDPESVRKLAALETPADVVRAFAERSEELPGYLRACDVMNASPVTLLENDTLGTAIETFAVRNVLDIPLLDPDGDIRGTVSLEDILKLSLPEHLLWMNDLSPILHFQPFAEMLRSENETKLADFMREDVETVEADVPAIQLAKIFLMKRVRQIIVTRDGKFIGAVSLQGFSTKLFWA